MTFAIQLVMHKEYDVVIVGGGPAGVTAAFVLGSQKYRVLVLDKEHFPRKKLCGGCLTAKTLWLVERVFNVSEDTLTTRNIIDFKSHRFDIRFKTKPLVTPISPYAFRFVDRQVYDAFFLKKVKEVGVDVSEGEKVIRVRPGPDSIELETSRGRVLTAPFVIAADGANSAIRTELQREKYISGGKWQRNLACSVETVIPRKGNFQDFSVPILSFGYLRYGYAWIFPNRERLVVGMGGLARLNRNLPRVFATFLNDFNLGPLDSQKLQGFPLPFGNSLSKPYYKNLLLVGDAAGLVDPMLGEGIYQAHISGELAALAIIDSLKNTADNRTHNTAGPAYLELLRRHLLTEFTYARRFRRILYNPLGRLLGYRHIKLLKRHFSKLAEVVHGGRTYKWFKKITPG